MQTTTNDTPKTTAPKTAAPEKNPAPVDTNAGVAAAEDGGGWEDVSTDRLLYKPGEECGKAPVVGLLVSLEALPETVYGDWFGYIIKTTQPGKAVDFEGAVVDYPAGTEVIITATVKARQALQRFVHPTHIFEVFVKPVKQIKLAGGKKMWTFEVKHRPSSMRRRDVLEAAAAKMAPQLPGKKRKRPEDDEDDEIPFG